MSDTGRQAVIALTAAVVFDELSVVTPAMLEIGSKTMLDLTRRGMERRPPTASERR